MIVAHKCLQCGSELSSTAQAMKCSACGAWWPVDRGVAVYQSAEYFGEISREDMEKLVQSAAAGHWLHAARARFEELNPDMYHYIADLNRASWIPLLPIGPHSTVLDVGSGLGGLTHALALNYERVVSIEPIEERVRFTRTRLEQEGLTNVDLVQTTVDRLPFFEKTFDLIVLNGILEWLAAWLREGSPRKVQIEVLSALRRLLKPDGVVLIGIENRIGFESFLGRMDHPGTRFTNLMPRGLASLYLKLRRPGFHRMLLDPAQGYRTYTYSPRGYAKLLREAGFDSVELWWPPQGYNLPHDLIRLSEHDEIRLYLELARDYENLLYGRTLRRIIKDWALVKTGLIFSMVPDVVMVAGSAAAKTRPADNASLMDSVKRILAAGQEIRPSSDHAGGQYRPISLRSVAFRNRSVITMGGPNGSRRAIVKLANVRLPGTTAIAQEFALLQRLRPLMDGADPCLQGGVPQPVGFIEVGPVVAGVESAAQGSLLDGLVAAPGYLSNRDRVRRHLDLVASWLIAAHPLLNPPGSEAKRQTVPAAWWRPPDSEDPVTHDVDNVSWVQHGDFHSGNVFLDRDEQRLCVIDWEQCRAGYPPLFDWFCLVTSLYFTHTRNKRVPRGQTLEEISFQQTFFEPSWFADHVTSLTDRLCDSLGLDYGRVIEYFRRYLCVRHHQFKHERELSQKARWSSLYRASYDFFMKNCDACIFQHPWPGKRGAEEEPAMGCRADSPESKIA